MRPTGEPQKDEPRYLSPRSSGWWRGFRAAKAKEIQGYSPQVPAISSMFPTSSTNIIMSYECHDTKKWLSNTALKYKKEYLSFIWRKSESVQSRMVALPSDSLRDTGSFHIVAPESQSDCHSLRPCVLTPGNAFQKETKRAKKKKWGCFILQWSVLLSSGWGNWGELSQSCLQQHLLNNSWPEVDHVTTSCCRGLWEELYLPCDYCSPSTT